MQACAFILKLELIVCIYLSFYFFLQNLKQMLWKSLEVK